MTKLDWQFGDFPVDESDLQDSSALFDDSSTLPPPSPEALARSRKHRRIGLAIVAAVLVSGAAIVGLVAAAGWRQIRAQVSTLVEYEDQYSWARDVDVVKGIQAQADGDWIHQRAEEAALGLSTSLPAHDLVPVPGPPEILDVTEPEADIVEVRVLRRYADSSGTAYGFELTQRYHNASPGEWERMPLDEKRFMDLSSWTGRRLIAVYPELDGPWASAALPRLDDILVAACVDWECPDDLIVPLVLSSSLQDIPRLPGILRIPDSTSAYPIIFDMVPPVIEDLPWRTQYPKRVVLPSPHLTGYPHDDAAAAALTRSAAVRLLAYLADQISGAAYNGGAGDYFQNALIAREEIRLGLSPAPVFAPDSYVPPSALWSSLFSGMGRSPRMATRLHMQVLQFMDFAIADRPPAVEAELLRNLRRRADLTSWLQAGLGAEAVSILDDWAHNQGAAAIFPLAQLHGLAYSCGNGVEVVRSGELVRLPLDLPRLRLLPAGLSRQGNYLTVMASGESGAAQLHLVDLGTLAVREFGPADPTPLGWTGTGEFAYLAKAADDRGSFPRLMLFNPGTGQEQPVTQMEIVPFGVSWSPDGMWLGVTVHDEENGAPQTRPALVSFNPDHSLVFLADEGYLPTFSSSGTRVMFVSEQSLSVEQGTPELTLFDLETRTASPLAPAGLTGPGDGFLHFRGLAASSDGMTFAVQSQLERGSDVLFTVTLPDGDTRMLSSNAEGVSPLGFSADGRYLETRKLFLEPNENRFGVLDLKTRTEEDYPAVSVAWSAEGHLVAVSTLAGVYVIDPETGKFQWQATGNCSTAWYAEWP